MTGTEIRIPKLGLTMEQAKLKDWCVADGAKVESGQAIYELETDKAVAEVEAPVTGHLRIVEAAPGTYKVGHLMGYIE